MNTTDFSSGYDIAVEPVFASRIRPFIEAETARLKDFDTARRDWVRKNLPPDYHLNYIFHEHAARVANDMRKTALHMGLSKNVAENLYWAMLPHDIGKRLLPVSLWDMIEKPSGDIKNLRRSHTERGVEILDAALGDIKHPFMDLTRDIMLNHHEQMDGNGYRGLTGKDLTAPVRLACIVESFDGYGIERPHFGDRDISVAGVLKRMRDEKGATHYDMELFEAFAEMKLNG